MLRAIYCLVLISSIFIQHGFSATLDKDTDMTQPRFYYLKIGVKYLPVVFEINGVPTDVNTEDDGFETETTLNNWLKPEKNKITVTIDEPSEAAYILGQPSLKIQLAISKYGQKYSDPDNDETLFKFSWPNNDEEEIYPKVFEFEFEQIQDAHTVRTQLWQEAESITELTDADKQAILEVVQEIESEYMVNKNPEKLFKLMRYVFKEDTLARGNNFAELKAAVLEQLEWVMALDGLVLRPLTLENAKFIVVGDKHLVKVERTDREETILIQEYRSKESNDGRDVSITLYFAKINGQWTAVRG